MSASGHVVLIGAGHAHLHVLDRVARLRSVGLDVTLVAPSSFDYSGTAVAAAVGTLPSDVGRLDVAAIAQRRGVCHEVGTAACLDPVARRVVLDDGRALSYTLVSLNVGSVTAPSELDVADGAVRTKPLTDLRALRDRMAALPTRPRVAVVGGGASGLELAGNLVAALGPDARVTLFEPAGSAVGGLPRGPTRRALRLLAARGVQLRAARVRRAAGDHVLTAEGRERQDLVVVATGLGAARLIQRAGLGDARGAPVRADLRHVDHDDVLAVGDCAQFLPRPLPRLGVYGVRAAPVLLEGIAALHQGRPPPRFRPPRHALQILDLGAGHGLAVRGPWWFEGRTPLLVKRRIDRGWLAHYRGIAAGDR